MYLWMQAAANLPHINEEQEQPTAEATEGQEGGKWSNAHLSNIDLGNMLLVLALVFL